ncbi:MAG: serine/threonine protein kinase [Deltaproteobacteria bacterium]|nr:serine/threonine protein kinase [Deltaproteobacteria bacterium]MBW1874684.1 serine/threonine protein kinase [Deltaproteobacteria bacterium]MBW2209653.1 serine/threonine protein kinase [Deltaproteobacteria bacterium]MBW2378878.1 serine/threonine protein kinase [Deltaproteobacteria bacterium]MBW2549718.1 serine/threonine protein kinase [Deltaproteobacteria bacterium]
MSEERPLLGPYHIERRLAAGGMAEIFVARREGLHGFSKRVALKRILPQFSSDPDFVWMFIDEARLAALLEHPNIVQVFDFGTMGDDLVLVMELVDGSNVSRVLRTASEDLPIPWDVALHIAYQTAQALDYAHHAVDDKGEPLEFVHRDVSPANILLSRTGHVKLTDFGIATVRSRAPTTEDGQVRGKLGYMSPEQVLGKELSGKSDVFTLSTVLAEMLIGEPLFQGESELNVLLQIRDADLRVLARCERRIPQDIRTLVLRGLQRDPAERPTAGAFAEACAEVIRRRGMGHGPDRVARLLSQLNLVEGEGPDVHLPGAKVPSLVDSDLMHHAGQELIGPQAVTSPTIYRVQLTDGSVMGPMSYPRLIQLLTTGVIDSRSSKISKADGTYLDPSRLPELTRFVTSPGLQWKLEELAQAEKQGQLRAATLLPVFYDIISRQQTGVLHLWQRNRRKKIYFVDGKPDFVASTDKSELLGEYLVATGQCLRMEIEMALALLPKYGGRLGDALVGLGILRPVELFRAISDQVRGRLMESFRWRRGEWAFVRGARSHEETFPTGQDPYELLRDAASEAHLEEIESVLEPLGERVVERCEDGPPLTVFRLPPTWVGVLDSVSGDTTLGGVLARESASGADLEPVYRALYLGLACGLVRTKVSPSQMPFRESYSA